MTVFVQLTTIGTNAGPFTIFSNLNYSLSVGTATAVDISTGITVTVPDGTTSVRVVSTGACTNFIDIPVTVAPSACSTYYVGASVKTDLIYRDCSTGETVTEPLSAGGARLICAYNDLGSAPFFSIPEAGLIEERGACGSGRPGCTQTTLFATAGGGGVTFRFFECESNQSTTITLADGITANYCIRNDISIQLVSGVGNYTQGSACTV